MQSVRVRTSLELGLLIKAARVAGNLRQRDAADLCGVSERFLVQLEQGKPGARLDLVLKVCHGLGVGIEAHLPNVTPPEKRRTRQRRLRPAEPSMGRKSG